MAKRPAGIRAFVADFRRYDLERARLSAFRKPVLFVLGGHFDPPHRIKPGRLAELLRQHWDRSE